MQEVLFRSIWIGCEGQEDEAREEVKGRDRGSQGRGHFGLPALLVVRRAAVILRGDHAKSDRAAGGQG